MNVILVLTVIPRCLPSEGSTHLREVRRKLTLFEGGVLWKRTIVGGRVEGAGVGTGTGTDVGREDGKVVGGGVGSGVGSLLGDGVVGDGEGLAVGTGDGLIDGKLEGGAEGVGVGSDVVGGMVSMVLGWHDKLSLEIMHSHFKNLRMI